MIYFDTETTGNAGAPHLIELGAVRVEGGEAVEHFQRLVRSEGQIAPEAEAIHGLSDLDLADAAPVREVLEEFDHWVGDDALVAHDVRRDARVLGFEYTRLDREAPPGPLFDSLKLARHCLPDMPDHQLGTLVQELEIEWDPPHRALPDATACWQLVEHCVGVLDEAELTATLTRHAAVPLTLRTAGPKPPRRHRAHARALERARRDASEVEVVYGGEGESPSPLPVRPRLVYQWKEKAYLEGECLRSGLLKTYRLDRVQRVRAR